MDKERVRSAGLGLGFTKIGFCSAEPPESIGHYRSWRDASFGATMGYLTRSISARSNLIELLPDVQTVVATSLNYNQANPRFPDKPRIARYALGRDYHKVVRGKLKKLAAAIEELNPNAKHRICVDSAPVLEREFANRAGLGWFGKNTCLIDSRTGSWFFIGILLTTERFEPDRPAVGGCGKCTKCIDACPTGAIVQLDGKWSVDARKCISYLTIEHRGEIRQELQDQIDGWSFGCDVCQEVCPFNESRLLQPDRAQATADPDFLRLRDWPDLDQISEMKYEQWDELTRGSPVRRAGFEGLKRNVNINRKNRERSN